MSISAKVDVTTAASMMLYFDLDTAAFMTLGSGRSVTRSRPATSVTTFNMDLSKFLGCVGSMVDSYMPCGFCSGE